MLIIVENDSSLIELEDMRNIPIRTSLIHKNLKLIIVYWVQSLDYIRNIKVKTSISNLPFDIPSKSSHIIKEIL